MYESNDSRLDELEEELYDINEKFFDKKRKRYFLLILPVGIVFAIITYFACNDYLIPTGKFDYIASLFISTFGAATFSIVSSDILASKQKFDKFIVKIFPKLQVYCDKILILKNNIAKKTEEMQDIVAHQNGLNFSNHSIGEIIEVKRRELDRLTNDYFDNIENDHVMEEKETKGKTRVRTPKNI